MSRKWTAKRYTLFVAPRIVSGWYCFEGLIICYVKKLSVRRRAVESQLNSGMMISMESPSGMSWLKKWIEAYSDETTGGAAELERLT